ncbi:MAG: cupin domain-containing protein [Oscillospiraceae bacterium]|nr:cupin domain-containing protein [Oscillospiraceae bacterium]
MQTHEKTDFGPDPLVINIPAATRRNRNFRTAVWTGGHLQMTLMRIPVCGDIGLEIHHDEDQLIRIEEGRARIQMGSSKETLDYERNACAGCAVFVPAGTWHNITNIGNGPLKLSSVYAPPHHPLGTIHKTKEDARD